MFNTIKIKQNYFRQKEKLVANDTGNINECSTTKPHTSINKITYFKSINSTNDN